MIGADCFGLSEQGRDPDSNDDCVAVDRMNGIMAVADGLGGRPAGAQASSLAVRAFSECVRNLEPQARLREAHLQSAVEAANRAVRTAAAEDRLRHGMGTTLTAAVFVGTQCRLVHVGDSRAYSFANKRLTQLTCDHTLGAELITRRYLSPENAGQFALAHVLSRAIGTQETVRADISGIPIGWGDWLLLVTDGVWRVLNDEDLAALFMENESSGAEVVCRSILREAFECGSQDNMAVAAARFLRSGYRPWKD